MNAQALPAMLRRAYATAFTQITVPVRDHGVQAAVAQLVEQGTFNPKVVGSSPTGGILLSRFIANRAIAGYGPVGASDIEWVVTAYELCAVGNGEVEVAPAG